MTGVQTCALPIFGYPFKELAESIRHAVAMAIDAQVGVSVASVDVCIDGLVFPKE